MTEMNTSIEIYVALSNESDLANVEEIVRTALLEVNGTLETVRTVRDHGLTGEEVALSFEASFAAGVPVEGVKALMYSRLEKRVRNGTVTRVEVDEVFGAA